MSMKKILTATVVTTAISSSILSGVYAAQPAKVKVEETSYVVNGNTVAIRSVEDGNVTLVSIRDLVTALNAEVSVAGDGTITTAFAGHTVQVKKASTTLIVDGQKTTLGHAVLNVQNINFVEPEIFVKALGAVYTKDDSGQVTVQVSKEDLLENESGAQWLNADKLVVSQLTDDGRVDYLVDAKTGKYSLLMAAGDYSDLAISPDATKAAYTDSDSNVYLLDIATGKSTKISTDTTIKKELQWSADGSKLFFLQTDKGSIICEMNPTDGKITTVLDDKVDYKANLSVSNDGKKFVYTVTKAGTTVADGSKAVDLDDVTIDVSATDPQVFRYDSSVAGSKAVQLTRSTDDKVFVGINADASEAYYVKSGTATTNSIVVAVNAAGETRAVYADRDVLEAVYSNGKLYVMTVGSSDTNTVFEIDPATKAKKLVYNVSDATTQIIVSGSNIALEQDGKIIVYVDGGWKALTN